jgi:hypothetical protein
MVGRNTSLSDSETRRVSQTAHEAHTLREAGRKVQIGTGCIALPLGLSSSLTWVYCSCGHGSVERLLSDHSATLLGFDYVYFFSRQFKRKKTAILAGLRALLSAICYSSRPSSSMLLTDSPGSCSAQIPFPRAPLWCPGGTHACSGHLPL